MMDIRSCTGQVVLVFCLLLHTATSQNNVCTSPGGFGNRIFINNVPEDKPVGSVVSHLNITGSDSEIELQQTSSSQFFQFDPVSRNLTVIGPLISEKEAHKLTIECRIKAWSQKVQFSVIVEILDLNNHVPQFQNLLYKANISELSPVGTTVFTGIYATDADHSNYYVSYEVSPGQFSDCFSIPAPAQGILVLKKMLDYEQIQTLKLSITAKDKHPALSNHSHVTLNASTEVTIYVQDGDDQNPVFSSKSYTGTVTENDVKGTMIDLNISAHDPDVSVESALTYSIVQDMSNGDWEYFTIDSTTGEVTLARDGLLRGLKLSFLVQATKVINADRYTEALVKVEVQAANENPPYFVQEVYTTTLVENVPVGSVVVTVTAFDNDQVEVIDGIQVYNKNAKGTILVYSFMGDVQDFTINSKTGVIQTKLPLDYEKMPQHSIKVSVTDGTSSDTATVVVNLVNTNNHNPQFDQNTYTFGGKREKGFIVGTVKAADADFGSTVKYSFSVQEQYFRINEETGVIEVTGEPEDLTESVYLLSVVAKDEGIPPRQDSVRVSVTFDPISVPVVQGSSNMVVVIVLGILLFILVAVLAVLSLMLYRKHQQTDKSPNKRCVRSRSFEQSIDFSRKDYTSYLDPPKGLAYKPSTKHHLDIYDGVGIDTDSTATAENPFASQDSTVNRQTVLPNNIDAEVYDQSIYDFHSAPDINYPTGSDGHVQVAPPNIYARPPANHGILGTANSNSSVNQNSALSFPSDNFQHPSSSHSNSNNVMVGSYDPQIPGSSQYDSNLRQAYDDDSILRYKAQNYAHGQLDGDISPRSSLESDDHYNGDLTSFKAGSTTRLVGAPSKNKSRGSSNKGSGNISYVDAVDFSPPQSLYSSMTSQRSGMDPGNTLQSDDGRPGITVYY